jgi:hypothetical protein
MRYEVHSVSTGGRNNEEEERTNSSSKNHQELREEEGAKNKIFSHNITHTSRA